MPPRLLRHDRLRTVSRIHVMRQLSNEFSTLRVSRRSRREGRPRACARIQLSGSARDTQRAVESFLFVSLSLPLALSRS